MTFFKRLFSSDFRAAMAAEAAGDLELAAERYALAGQRDAAVRMHLERSARADSRDDAIEALRDALHWATPELAEYQETKALLGKALLARAREQGVATERDRERVREASRLLVEAGAHADAAEALEAIGDDAGAARAFERGGMVYRMEEALSREAARSERNRRLSDAFADYEACLRSGERETARDALRTCVELAERKGDYRRLLDDLESRLIASGRVALRRRSGGSGKPAILCGGESVVLGRDALCDLVLRAGGISRRHAEIELGDEPLLRDLKSRNGTLVGGLPIEGAVPLRDRGAFALGEDCELAFEVTGAPPVITLRIATGLDAGARLRAAPAGQRIPLADLLDVPARVRFRDGRPLLAADEPSRGLLLNGSRIAVGEVQLIHGDELSIDGVELEVE